MIQVKKDGIHDRLQTQDISCLCVDYYVTDPFAFDAYGKNCPEIVPVSGTAESGGDFYCSDALGGRIIIRIPFGQKKGNASVGA